MSFVNKSPKVASSDPQEMMLDPDYILSVFTVADVIMQYEMMTEAEDEATTGFPPDFDDLPRELQLGLVEAAQRVFNDCGQENDAIADAVTDSLKEASRDYCNITNPAHIEYLKAAVYVDKRILEMASLELCDGNKLIHNDRGNNHLIDTRTEPVTTITSFTTEDGTKNPPIRLCEGCATELRTRRANRKPQIFSGNYSLEG